MAKTLVSSGQITMMDLNDARPIDINIVTSQGQQQVYSKDESTVIWTPNYASTPNILTAYVYVGDASGALEVSGQLTNRKWSLGSLESASLGSGTTLTVNTNLTPGISAQATYFFQGDYTDPTTGLIIKVVSQMSLSVVETGSNAVFLQPRGTSAITQANGTVKNVAAITIDLVRASGVDTTNITYKFYKNNGATQITTADATAFGMKATGAAMPVGTAASIGVGLPAANAWSTSDTLVIHESAVADIATFRAEAKDGDGKIYQVTFSVTDTSDPYQTNVNSSIGDRFPNGVGTTNMYATVYRGASQLSVAETADWDFVWTFYDRKGNRAGYVDQTKTAVAGGRVITSNTAGAACVITYPGGAIVYTPGDMVKIVKDGIAYYHEVASGTTNANLTLRAATISTFLNVPWPTSAITANKYAGGVLFACTGNGATAGQRTTTGTGSTSSFVFTGDDLDAMGKHNVDSYRP